jgi:hypothetical protein
MARWVLFGVVAVAVGLAAFVLLALGLIVGAALVGIFSVGAALLARRRAGNVPYAGRKAEGNCVELGRDSYTVQIVEEKKPSPGTHI